MSTTEDSPKEDNHDSESEDFEDSEGSESEDETKVSDEDDKSEEEEELKDESSDSVSEEETYQAQPDSDDEDNNQDSNEEDNGNEPEEDLDDDLLAELPDEEEEPACEDDEEPQEELPEGDGDEDQIFDEGKRKKTAPRKKGIKKRLFPFLKRRRKTKTYVPLREPPEYNDLDIRQTAKNFLETMELKSKDIGAFEKAIYNATVRRVRHLEDITIDSTVFKRNYLEILSYMVGAFPLMDKEDILAEIKTDNCGWNSKLYAKFIIAENKELDKIRNPVEASEYPDNPCSKCKGIKLFMYKKQLRGGDEGMSAIFWCQTKGCGHHWRVNG